MERAYFDEVVNRRGTNCAKYDEMDEKYGKDVLHCGVADMDFRVPAPIREACRKVTDIWLHQSAVLLPGCCQRVDTKGVRLSCQRRMDPVLTAD